MIPIKSTVQLFEDEDIGAYLYYSFESAYQPQSGIQQLMLWLNQRQYEHWQIHGLEHLAFTDLEEANRFMNEYPHFI